MNQIFILIIAAFVAYGVNKIFGLDLYLVLAVCAVLYLVWFQFLKYDTIVIDNISEKTSIDRFINSDTQLKNLIQQLNNIKMADEWVHDSLIKDIHKFISLYLLCFIEGTDSFQKLIDTRRDILNTLHRTIFLDVPFPKEVIKDFGDCTWKYVYAIVTKYDLSNTYPIASNTIGNNYDLY